MKILANDGLSKSGVSVLENAGFEVILKNIAQNQLNKYINDEQIHALLVRSATQAKKELIDACPSLKLIGRGGVGMDNIDVTYAKKKGIHIINTPSASSHAVAELVFAHLFGVARFLYDSNRNMPLEGDSKFNNLKASYSKGFELRGKTLGVIGFGRIGQAAAKIAISLGMKVLAADSHIESTKLRIEFFDARSIDFVIHTVSKEEVLKNADFITLHVPAQKKYVISTKEFDMMKNTATIVNVARGGVIDENALIEAIKNNKIANAALDVFEQEPSPAVQILMNSRISLTPHIGAATQEAQDRIGIELADQVIKLLK